MPKCRKCGAYTKYNNGLCHNCYYNNKSKKGKVYIGELSFKNGTKKLYTGQTKRSVYTRIGEHIGNINNHKIKTYTGKGSHFRLIGSIFSTNRFKAEKTIKKLTPYSKKKLAYKGARNYNKKR